MCPLMSGQPSFVPSLQRKRRCVDVVGLDKRRFNRLITAISKYTKEEGKEIESVEGLLCAKHHAFHYKTSSLPIKGT